MNISENIEKKRALKLHNNKRHPIFLLKKQIQSYFQNWNTFDSLSEVVTVEQNFDELLIPQNHPARNLTDSYYIDEHHMLRTHTSAHQCEILKQGKTRFLITGDVYRKDTIDHRHYPVFHQMEGVKLCDNPLEELKKDLSGLMEFLYPGCEYRFLDDYFPFTNPSLQIEVKTDAGEWMEVLGCGVIQPEILKNCGIEGTGYAFGLGLDRLVMQKCKIPDIRYLWSPDKRFISQFKNGLTEFKEYSKYPHMRRDMSFWIPETWSENEFYEICRNNAGDLIEEMECVDKFQKGDKTSLTYKIIYRSNDRTLTIDEINELQDKIRDIATNQLKITLR